MIQLNNKHFRHAGGYSQGLRIPSVSSAPGESLKDDTMNKAELIKEVQNCEFHFSDYGICGVREDGVVVSYGEPCYVEHNGKWVIANLWRLPKIWAECCLDSNYHYEWHSPEYADEYHKMYMREMEAEFGGQS